MNPDDTSQSIRDLGEAPRVVVFDIARFAVVNDEYGHDVGDRLSAAVEARLQAQAPGGAQITRIWPGQWEVDLTRTADPVWALLLLTNRTQMRPLAWDGPVQHVYFHIRPSARRGPGE